MHPKNLPSWDGTVSSGVQIGFEKSEATEEMVTRSVTIASAESVSKDQEVNYGLTLSGEVSAKGGFAGVAEVGWKAGIAISVGGSTTWSSGTSRSRENTVETAVSKASSMTDSYNFTITGDDPYGKYRWTLFGTTDVYVVIQTDKDRTYINDSYLAFCSRGDTCSWGVDYEPDFNGTFKKNTPNELLELPELNLLDLPVPTSNELGPIPAPAALEADPAGGGTYHNEFNVTLTSVNGGVIYYTTNGETPTAESTVYTGPITITHTCTLKAIAIVAGQPPSEVMIENYIINYIVLQTEWNRPEQLYPNDYKSNSNNLVTDTQMRFDYISVYPTDYFDKQWLADEGYTHFRITVTFDVWCVDDGYIDVRILQDHSTDWNATKWGELNDYDPVGEDRWHRDKSFTSDNIPFSSFYNNFTIAWDAHGAYNDDYYYANVRIKVTAHR